MAKDAFSPSVHGWLVMDKPMGLTSTQALGRARRLLCGDKVGHGGTLDPLATGVLPLAFGEATKMIPYVMDGDKEYAFTVRWGEKRATGDAEGDVIAQSDVRPNEAQIRDVLPSFIGDILQKPPAYSAIKVEGARAYDLARSGENVDLPPRHVRINKLDLIRADAGEADFHAACGKGMYVRSLASDIAEKLGTLGYVSELRRTRVGPFSLEKAVALPELERLAAENKAAEALLPLKAALGPMPVLSLLPNEANVLRLGQGLLIKPHQIALLDAPVIFAEEKGVPVALLKAEHGAFRVLRGFHFS